MDTYEKKYKEALERAEVAYKDTDRHIKATIERIFPQLRESEDERIWKAIDEIMKLDKAWEIAGKHGLTVADIRRWVKKQKEQKPVDVDEIIRKARSEGRQEVIDNPEYYQLLKPEEVQKLAEWSEEDKNMCTHLNGYLNGFSCSEDAIKQMADWFYELPNRFNLQPKQEWSEEDETFVKDAIEAVENYYSKGCGQEELVSWLKSLRPNPHTVSIKDATKFGNLEYERGVKDGVQSEKNRQWKPSEEQMEELWNVISYIEKPSSNFLGVPALIESLYEELRKLCKTIGSRNV